MGKHRIAIEGGTSAQKGASPTLSSHGGKAGDTGNTVQDLMEEVSSLEEVLLQMGASSKTPFRIIQSSRLPSE